MRNIKDIKIYLERMAKPLQEKMKIVQYIPEDAQTVVDVGCADGAITIEMAKMFPQIQFLGIDLDERFVKIAQERAGDLPNVRFEKIYLRDLLARPEKYDVVIFISVLHEFYTYGEGISSVLKALADAHELLNKDGVIIIRDMILGEYTKKATLRCPVILHKIDQKTEITHLKDDFENRWGKLNNVYKIDHFLLKYGYTENWDRESKENYVPVTFEQYEQIFNLLDMVTQYRQSYLIPYFAEKWKEDFAFLDEEIEEFRSTGILVAQKTTHSH